VGDEKALRLLNAPFVTLQPNPAPHTSLPHIMFRTAPNQQPAPEMVFDDAQSERIVVEAGRRYLCQRYQRDYDLAVKEAIREVERSEPLGPSGKKNVAQNVRSAFTEQAIQHLVDVLNRAAVESEEVAP
jgi:hypothetical protein